MTRNNAVGYNKNLFVLPFDHRASFVENLLSFKGELNINQKQTVTDYKTIIYEAIDKAIDFGIPRENAAVLVDEIYGKEILKDAKARGFITMQTVEKSGVDIFECEFGDDFGNHLLEIKPTFAKVLVRYNAEGNKENNQIQLERIKKVSDFASANDLMLLIEPLVIATDEQLKLCGNDKHRFDKELRKDLTIKMINEFYQAEIVVDVWKIEGFENASDYESIITVAQERGNRPLVGVIILGRNETKERVREWITAGRNVNGIIGFAVGRTIFWEPLTLYRDQKISRDDAIQMIAKEYYEIYRVFTNK